MSTPVPTPATGHDGLPPVSLDFDAWLKFNTVFNAQLRQFEERFVRPREHELVKSLREPAAGRMAPKKPR